MVIISGILIFRIFTVQFVSWVEGWEMWWGLQGLRNHVKKSTVLARYSVCRKVKVLKIGKPIIMTVIIIN